MRLLKDDSKTRAYYEKAKRDPKIIQPVKNSEDSITWKIRAPREDRLHVLFFEYEE